MTHHNSSNKHPNSGKHRFEPKPYLSQTFSHFSAVQSSTQRLGTAAPGDVDSIPPYHVGSISAVVHTLDKSGKR
ncbi:hypothetical protein CHS0354_024603 [Potamilus streckersoni]|uniref:Uncharacterized protein n=1 Tax=Potamilus streckersoni TaxID=2493646 RepID=A0AAE0SU62_9BIVA|nr:hypothetical protein CHS0354_024603 [Potamilus streckersoni]